MSKVRNSIPNPSYPSKSYSSSSSWIVGKVFDVKGDSVYYLPYPGSKIYDNYTLEQCRVAKPLFPNTKYCPLKEELILVLSLPSPESQNDSLSKQDYYVSVINIWGNNHHNIQAAYKGDLNQYFKENPDIRSLLTQEGDYIMEGRFGQGIRLGSSDNKPRTIITNNYKFDSSSLSPHQEDINNDESSIWFSSGGEVPLKVSYSGEELDKYEEAQIILNGERLVFNSKNDKILMFGGKGINFFTDQKIVLKALDKIHLDSKRVVLGEGENFEPLMKGDSTNVLLMKLTDVIKKLAIDLTSSVSTPAGTPLLNVINAATSLNTALEPIIKQLENKSLLSDISYTS